MTDATDLIHARIQTHLDTLTTALSWWEGRDDSKAQPHVRHAANDAMDAIDTMLLELHEIRARLAGEIRASDDAAAARADALLERVREAGHG